MGLGYQMCLKASSTVEKGFGKNFPMAFIGEILPTSSFPCFSIAQRKLLKLLSTVLLPEYLSLTGLENNDSGGCRTQNYMGPSGIM